MRRWVAGIVVFPLLWLAVLGAAGALARPAHADVAIVFGNTVLPDGTPSPRLAARLSAALDLYRAHTVARIVVSGGTGVEGRNEATSMAAWLRAHDVPDTAIVIEPTAMNTAETCQRVAAWMHTDGARSANVVTQWFHVPRAWLACRRAGVEVVGGHAPAYVEPRDVPSLVREGVGLPAYAVGLRDP